VAPQEKPPVPLCACPVHRGSAYCGDKAWPTPRAEQPAPRHYPPPPSHKRSGPGAALKPGS
jgi:hypothetical protein